VNPSPEPAGTSEAPAFPSPDAYRGAPYGWAEPDPRPRRPWGRTLTVTGLTVVALAVAGGPLGLLWRSVAPAVPVLNAGEGRILIQNPAPEEYVAADGWFALLGFGFGLLAAIVAWMTLRRDRGPFLVLGVTLGSLAAALVAWQAGRLIGRAAWADWRETSAAGATYQAPPDLHALGTLLVPAFAAVIVLTLLAGWSNDPNLDLPGAHPGHGRDFGPDPDGPGWGGPGSDGGPGPDPDGPGRGGPGSDGGPGPGGGAGHGWAGPASDGESGPGWDRPDPGRGGPGPGGYGPPVSSGWPGGPDPTAAPAPPAPGPAGPPHG
jgi:hypothetical protein